LNGHEVVQHDEWIEAREALLKKEKEFTRARDELSQRRRELPWERVEKSYAFEGPAGKETLGELFDGCSQLVENVFHAHSSYARGIDLLNTAYNYLDLAPKGRDEDGRGQYSVRRHDEYGATT
jgi:predicted dithiol-disulfide oxidoreductase (DUF899 family)